MINTIRHFVNSTLEKTHLVEQRELIIYLFVGGGTTVVDWVLYTLFVLFIPPIGTQFFIRVSPNIVAYSVSWFGAVIFAYVLSRLFVFESKNERIVLEILKFVSSRVITLFISIIGDAFFCGEFALVPVNNPFIIKIGVSIIVIVLNYVSSKIFVFRKVT